MHRTPPAATPPETDPPVPFGTVLLRFALLFSLLLGSALGLAWLAGG